MESLLHLVATPRGETSRTLRVSRRVVDRFLELHPGGRVDELNLFEAPLPPLTARRVDGKYVLLAGGDLAGELKEAWEGIEAEILRFLAADAYLLTVPMWNFGIPYVLKHYIDVIVQPRYLFEYTDEGPRGLVTGRKMVVVTSRGGDYGPGSPAQGMDRQEPYLRTVFGFVGITDLTFLHAQPMDAAGEDVRESMIARALERAASLEI